MSSDETVEVVEDDAEPVEGYREQAEDTTSTRDRSQRAPSPGARLARLFGIQALIAIGALSLFAAADSWNTVTGLGLAALLCVVTGVIAGIALTTLIHEWFHLLGARFSGGRYRIPTSTGLFLYDWDYASNSVRQFYMMSIAGSVGGGLTVLTLWNGVPADSWGRAALIGAAIASFVYAAVIEWPVLQRTRASGNPLAELSKIDKQVLSRSFVVASVVGVVATLLIAP